jgi:hypothetical protein
MYLLDRFSLMMVLLFMAASSATKPPPPLSTHRKHFIPQDVFFCRSYRAEYRQWRRFYDFHLVVGRKSYEFASIATYFEKKK